MVTREKRWPSAWTEKTGHRLTEETPQIHRRRKHHRRMDGGNRPQTHAAKKSTTDTRREEKRHRGTHGENATDARMKETPLTHGRRKCHRRMDGGNAPQRNARRKQATDARTEETRQRRAHTSVEHGTGTSGHAPATPTRDFPPQSTQDGCGAPAIHPRGEGGEPEMSRFTSIKCGSNPSSNWRSPLNRRALHLE